jgi:type I restriction enzyme S subunit
VNAWPEVPFEALYAEPSRNGIYKPSEHHGTGAKIVNMGELFAHDFIGPQEMARLAMTPQELEKSSLAEGDLLFGRRSLVESGAGKCSIVEGITEPTTFESSIIRVRLDKQQAEPCFYYYWLRSPPGRGRIRAIVSGTNVKGIRSSDLKDVKVPRPDRAVQGKIVASLRIYDDMIDINRRRIQLLEESARLLYREWFVHLRFPGHEHMRAIDGIPEGWQRGAAADAMEVLSGGTPKTDIADYWDGEIPFYTPRDSTNSAYVLDTDKHLTELGQSKCNSRLYPKDTLFITARGTVGKLNLAQRPMAMNQSCYALIAKPPLTQHFLYCAMSAAIEQFKSRAFGTVFDAIVVDTFKTIPFLSPEESLVRSFSDNVASIFRQTEILAMQTIKLQQARDLLLPRLMSGEITV